MVCGEQRWDVEPGSAVQQSFRWSCYASEASAHLRGLDLVAGCASKRRRGGVPTVGACWSS